MLLDTVSAFGLVFELLILVYYGYITIWYYAIALFAIAFAVKNVLFWLAAKNKTGKAITFVAMLGFIGIPLSLLGVLYFFYQIYEGMGLDS